MAKRSAADRFWTHTHQPEDPDACWLFTAGHCRDGYAQLRVEGVLTMAHRFAYELLVGPIPSGLELDHGCRVRNCVNPSHLEAVTPRENTHRSSNPAAINVRKTHCPQGHPYDEANTMRYANRRYCRACRADARERKRAA